MDISDRVGSTALHQAALNGNSEILRKLLDAGSDVWAQDQDGWTAFNVCTSRGNSAVVKVLLEAQGNIWRPNKDGWTALHWAAEYGYADVIELLATDQDKLETKDNKGCNGALGSLQGSRARCQDVVGKGCH